MALTLTEDKKLPIQSIASVEKQIGNTPLHKVETRNGVEIYAKLEWKQLGGSIKSRPAFNIIKQALITGELHSGKRLLDATSGNTGIAYASIGAALGIPITLFLPENASKERKQILKSLGVNIIFTSPFGGTDEAQEAAKELARKQPDDYFYADQYSNHNNWNAHYENTANEIINQTDGRITHFVAGLGTTGTFTGVGANLREYDRNIKLTALQPDTPLHGLEGWKHLETANVPAIFNKDLVDEYREIATQRAYELMVEVAAKEGMLLSPSSAANLAGALQVAETIDKGVIVTVYPDDSEKYGDVIEQLFK